MTKKTLHQFYLDLIPNLITELLFFIPENEIREDIIEKIDFFKNNDILNKIYVFDHHYGPIEYEKHRNSIHILLKRSKLEQNIFCLLEMKGDVKMHEFHYVLNKYFDLVESFFYMTNWMNNNLTQIIKTDDGVIGLFHVQFLYFKKHFEELVINFYPNKEAIPKGNFNAHEIINTYFPDISKSFKPAKNLVIGKLSAKEHFGELSLKHNTQTITSKPQNIDKMEKKQLITEEEVEKILLRTFFSIKIKD